MISENLSLLLRLSLDLTRYLESSDRLQRLLSAIRDTLGADAAALLLQDGKRISVQASHGLNPEGKNKSWAVGEQPRLKIILESEHPIIFPADSQLVDPFDGFLAGATHALHSVHSCLGIPLRIDGRTLGCLTADALELDAFNKFDLEFLNILGALTSVTLKAALEREDLENKALRNDAWARSLQKGKNEFIGQAPAIQQFKRELELVAKSPFQLLLTGETGVGKDVAARTAHRLSPRADEPFIAVNCATIPNDIIESELFGHSKGAFTGAHKDKPGRFEIADGVTLFLDELGELPLTAQSKLLRFLESGETQRLGSNKAIKVDVRIIAATNKDLPVEVEQGRFRADLYHRVAVFPIEIPPLRERPDDIPLLAEVFAQTAQKQLHCGNVSFDQSAMNVLLNRGWQGNVRELRNVVFAAVLRAQNRSGTHNSVTITREDLVSLGCDAKQLPSPATLTTTLNDNIDETLPLAEMVDEFKRNMLRKKYIACDNNWNAVARELGMDRSNLHHLRKRLGIKN